MLPPCSRAAGAHLHSACLLLPGLQAAVVALGLVGSVLGAGLMAIMALHFLRRRRRRQAQARLQSGTMAAMGAEGVASRLPAAPPATASVPLWARDLGILAPLTTEDSGMGVRGGSTRNSEVRRMSRTQLEGLDFTRVHVDGAEGPCLPCEPPEED